RRVHPPVEGRRGDARRGGAGVGCYGAGSLRPDHAAGDRGAATRSDQDGVAHAGEDRRAGRRDREHRTGEAGRLRGTAPRAERHPSVRRRRPASLTVDLAAFDEMCSPTGAAALVAAAALGPTEPTFLACFERLRKHYPADLAKAALETCILRVKAA